MNITKLRKIWFTISSTLVLISIFSILIFGFNFGLDFTGGARWQISFYNEKNLADENTEKDIKNINKTDLEKFFSSQKILTQQPQIQSAEKNSFLITIQDLPDKDIQGISKKLKKEIGEFNEISYQKVDSQIGTSFKKKAIQAIIVALAGIIIFVAFSFRKIPKVINPWRFGTVAIIALFHDILIVLGIFVFLGYFTNLELDLSFITALLATLGFSVNDTIVILDRVRENIRYQKASETFEHTIENSIKQTLFRSINTSISTFLPLLALLFFGADTIFYFVLALTIGILIGTYSSIFLAAPLLVSWKNWADNK